MYINSTHIKIVKLIQSYKYISLIDLSEILLLNEFTLRNYLKDIRSYLNLQSSNLSLKDLINEIYTNKKLIYFLRKDQEFTKQEKIDYIIFNLLTNDIINLSKISQQIGVNKRGLNYYFDEINNILKSYKLIIKNNKYGIFLKGSNSNKSNLEFIYNFKLFLDKFFLPYDFRKDFITYIHRSQLRKFKNYKNIYPEICKKISPIVSKYTFKSFSSIYLSQYKLATEITINSLSENKLLKYKPSTFTKEKYLEIIALLKSTPLGKLHPAIIDLLFLALKHFTYSDKSFSKFSKDLALKIRPIFENHLKNKEFSNYDYFNYICPWIDFAIFRKNFKIFDFNYHVANLNVRDISGLNESIQKIQEIIPLFTKLDFIISGYMIQSKFTESDKKNKILIFDKIPEYIINIIITELRNLYNVDIVKAINVKEFYREQTIDTNLFSIVSLEKLNLNTKYKIIDYKISI